MSTPCGVPAAGIEDENLAHWQVTMKVGFTLDE